MAYDDVRSRIVTTLQAITDVGVVHNRYRRSDDWSRFLSMFAYRPTGATADILRGWMLTRVNVEPVEQDSSFHHSFSVWTFNILGMSGFNDAADSDGDFQLLVDTVKNALEADYNLDGEEDELVRNGVGFVTVRDISIRMFGSTLCHVADLLFPVLIEHETGS